MELVSVIVPVYNTGKRLRRCVESLVNQTYKEKEIIIVDDGSELETVELCAELVREYGIVTCYHQKNSGVSAARNLGIEKAKGVYLFFADADDYAETGMLQCMVDNVLKHNAELVIAGYFYDIPHQDGSVGTIPQKAPTKVLESRKSIRENMVWLWDSSLMYNVWNKLFCQRLIKEHEIRFPVGKPFNEDRDFIRDYLQQTTSIAVIDACFYHYFREDGAAATGKYRPEMFEIRKEEFHRLATFFQKTGIWDAKAKEYVCREHFDRIVGTVENTFHSEDMTGRKIIGEIKKILDDDDTKTAVRYSRPKSKKMRLIHLFYKIKCKYLIFVSTYAVFKIRTAHPEIFYRLRQSR